MKIPDHPDIVSAMLTGYSVAQNRRMDEQQRRAICTDCGERFYEGDKYYEDEDGRYHCELCLEGMSLEELMELFGKCLEVIE